MDMQQLINALNDDLANEFQAVIMYTVYSAQASGPFRPQLVQFFEGEVPDEQMHAKFLADKIVALGGIPTTTPVPVPPAEDEREMLENVLRAEEKAIRGYTERARMAEELGLKGLVVDLEDIVRDETGHYEETMKMLKNWPK